MRLLQAALCQRQSCVSDVKNKRSIILLQGHCTHLHVILSCTAVQIIDLMITCMVTWWVLSIHIEHMHTDMNLLRKILPISGGTILVTHLASICTPGAAFLSVNYPLRQTSLNT